MKVIFYPSDERQGGICMVAPALDCGLPVEEIARKDVPAGKPYLIVDAESLPADSRFFNAWEADFTIPHGHGIGADAWFAEQAARKAEQGTEAGLK